MGERRRREAQKEITKKDRYFPAGRGVQAVHIQFGQADGQGRFWK